MNRRGKGWVIAYAVLLAVAVAVAVNFYRDDTTRDSVPEEAERATQDALERNCEADRRFRLAYRERAIIERRFLTLQRRANGALARVTDDLQAQGPTLPAIVALGMRLDLVNAKLDELREALKVYPVPPCGRLPIPSRPDRAEPKGGDDARTAPTPEPRSQPAPGPAPDLPGAPGGGDGGDGGGGVAQPPPAPGPSPEPPDPPAPPPQPTPSPPPSKPPSVGQGLGQVLEGANGIIEGACTTVGAATGLGGCR